jgi:hypothetical protein
VTRALNRTTADLSSYPDLVVIYLGMRVNEPPGVRTLMSFGQSCISGEDAQGRSALGQRGSELDGVRPVMAGAAIGREIR